MNSQPTWPILSLRTGFLNFIFKENLSTLQDISLYFCHFSPIYSINNIFLFLFRKMWLHSYLAFFNVPFCFLNLGHSYICANQGLVLDHLTTSTGALTRLQGQRLLTPCGAYPVCWPKLETVQILLVVFFCLLCSISTCSQTFFSSGKDRWESPLFIVMVLQDVLFCGW